MSELACAHQTTCRSDRQVNVKRQIRTVKHLAFFRSQSVEAEANRRALMGRLRRHPLHDAADRVVLHLDQKMEVVWQQTVGIEIEGEF
jgi:hypothetical protein